MRLVAVGCSFLDMCKKKTLEDGTIQGTYSDFPIGTGNWGYYLAKKLNFDYLDYGRSGYSNEYMWRKSIEIVLSEKNIEDLFFVIGWTDSYRFEFYDEECHKFNTFHSNWFWEKKELKPMTKFYSFYQYWIRTLNYQITLRNFFKEYNIKYVFFDALTGPETAPIEYIESVYDKEPELLNLLGKEDSTKIIRLIVEKNKSNFMEEIQQKWLLNDKKYFGNDGWKGHPSQLGHDKWSDVIFKYIEENKIL
tara:strand:- start:6485 stop:7231 length:747 start_codon:yes stop_codon:yes gene_type:complete